MDVAGNVSIKSASEVWFIRFIPSGLVLSHHIKFVVNVVHVELLLLPSKLKYPILPASNVVEPELTT